MARQLKLKKFKDISLDDPFFDSLKKGYEEFSDWFLKKSQEDLYIVDNEGELNGMIYLKYEDGPVTDVKPALPTRRWLKVGTLKIVGKGTKLGERIIKKIFDTALSHNAEGVYITVFDIHESLISLFKRYGFKAEAIKETKNGKETVLIRYLDKFIGDMILDYPFISTKGKNFWLLAIYPEYHTRLLPDSILKNETQEIVQDVSHTNTIHKVYISKLALSRMSRGDIVVFYRTSDGQAPAYYRSVMSSICVVEEVRTHKSFSSVDEFLDYTRPRSVFDDNELIDWYSSPRTSVAKLTYNVAFNRRITRGKLLDEGVLSDQPRWDLRSLSREQLMRIIEMGQVNARIIID